MSRWDVRHEHSERESLLSISRVPAHLMHTLTNFGYMNSAFWSVCEGSSVLSWRWTHSRLTKYNHYIQPQKALCCSFPWLLLLWLIFDTCWKKWFKTYCRVRFLVHTVRFHSHLSHHSIGYETSKMSETQSRESFPKGLLGKIMIL